MECKLCQRDTETQAVYAGLVRCLECDLFFYPHQANIAAIYTKHYFTGEEYRNYLVDKSILQRNFRSRLQYLLGLKNSGRLLEIGCAYGFFLDLAQKIYDVSGVDISEDAVRHAKESGLTNVQCGDFLKLPMSQEKYDLLCLWDTIEHLEDPFLYLKKSSELLMPGGCLVLTTGDIGSLLAKLRGPKWRQIHPPSHLFYFSENTIRRALSQVGLETIEVKKIGQYRSYRSMLFEIFQLRMPRLCWAYSLLTLNGKIDFPIYLNTFDTMQVSAKKL